MICFDFIIPDTLTIENIVYLSNSCSSSVVVIHYYSLRPRQNWCHFTDCIFKCIFLNENELISLQSSLTCVPKVQINNIPSLVHIMAWCRPGNKPLSEPMMISLLMHICVTRPEWVITTMQVHTIITQFHYIVNMMINCREKLVVLKLSHIFLVFGNSTSECISLMYNIWHQYQDKNVALVGWRAKYIFNDGFMGLYLLLCITVTIGVNKNPWTVMCPDLIIAE